MTTEPRPKPTALKRLSENPGKGKLHDELELPAGLGGPGARGPFQRLKSIGLAFGMLCVIVGVVLASFVIGVVLAGLILLGLIAVIGVWLVSRLLRRRI